MLRETSLAMTPRSASGFGIASKHFKLYSRMIFSSRERLYCKTFDGTTELKSPAAASGMRLASP